MLKFGTAQNWIGRQLRQFIPLLVSFYNKKICSKMITSIIRHHTAIYYIMSITRDRFRPYWVSSLRKQVVSSHRLENKFSIVL